MTFIEQSKTTSWALPVGVLAIGTFALGTDSFVIAGILPQISHGLAISTAEAGQTVSIFALTYAIAAPLLAAVTSHFSRRVLLTSALALFIAANLISALAPTLLVLLLARVAAGLGAALYTPTASAAAAAIAGEAARGRAMSVVLGGLTLGTVAGVPLGTAIGQHTSWRASLVFVAMSGSVALAGVICVLPALPIPRIVALTRRFSVLARPQVILMVAYMVLVTAASFGFYTYAADLLAAGQGIRGPGLMLALFAWGVGGLIGSFGSGWATDRWGSRQTLTLVTGALALALVALGLVHSAVITMLVMVIYGAAGWAVSTPNNYRLTSEAPDLPAVAISFNSSGIYLGEALGSVIGGILISNALPVDSICITVAGIAAAALTLHLCIPDRTQNSTSSAK